MARTAKEVDGAAVERTKGFTQYGFRISHGKIIDGPQGSLRRLRNQLAEDGCAESQVVLAKQLLEEKCELEADKISNFKQALDWLICATEQAHPEARRMLRRCIRSGVIDEQSACIVRAKSCLAASRQEVVARKAARDLFASLSNGEQYITTAQLERRIREIASSLRTEEEDSDSHDDLAEGEERALDEGPALEPSPEGGDRATLNGTIRPSVTPEEEYPEKLSQNDEIRNLTVDNLVSAAVDYCQGELPLVSYDLTLTDPSVKSLDHIPVLHQAFLHPIVFIQVLYLKLLYYFGNFSFRLSNKELAVVLAAYLFVNTENLYHLVPSVLYYVSFAAMVICTFKMLHAKRQFVDFRKWSGLFLRYSDGNLQPNESENLFVKNNLGPFLQFFVALFINLFLYPFIATQWVPFSEFCVLSFLLMFLTLFCFDSYRPYPDVLALISFGVNVLAKYPYEKDTVVNQGWRFLDLYVSNYPFYILGSSIEFCLNARVFFSLIIPLIILAMAKRDNWQGFFKYAIPHCVTLSWLQMFITCSHGCTTYGLIRGTLGLVCAFLFVPLIGVATATLPIFACLQYVALSRMVYSVALAAGLSLSVGASYLMAKHEVTKKFVTPFQLLIGLITLFYFGNQFITNIQDDGIPSSIIDLIGNDKPSFKNLLKNEFLSDYDENTFYINWEDYYSQCHAQAWADSNVASTQIKCAVLDGANVQWEGYVHDVKLNGVKNRYTEFSEYLPNCIREYFNCYYGEEYESLCSESGNVERECQFVKDIARHSGKTCHLNNLNEYTYEVTVSIEASGGLLTTKRQSEITVIYDHHFTNLTKLLRVDDKIRLKGVLTNAPGKFNIGTKDFTVKGYEIHCLECKEAKGTISSKTPTVSKFSELLRTVVNDCVVSTKYILNFLLNPVIVFK